MVTRKWPIPAGFTWNHVADAYTSEDGRVWDPDTNSIVAVVPVPKSEAQTAGQSQQPLTTEQLIIKEGATAPRVTPADVEAAIKEERYTRLSGTLMICELTLQNGFVVTGESACASPENFRESIGRDVSRKNATAKIWPLLGYELRTRLATNSMIDVGTNFSKQEPQS
jgi:hypothetical protein